jgi:L-2-hydroxycarboxylate dehydrogenase (NAD+)
MPSTDVFVDFNLLERFMADGFRSLGMSESHAGICADVLITADRQGIDSHGVSRFKPVYVDRIRAGQVDVKAVPEIVREGPTTSVIDGRGAMGQVASKMAMTDAISRAGRYGTGMAAVRNSNHYGIAGYYVAMAAEKGMIGITGTNARPSVAPTFGAEPMFGTNPLAFGLPTDEAFPFVLDCATSASQRGKIEVSARMNKPVPDGWAVDRDCHPLHEAGRILEGLKTGDASLVPLGGTDETTGGHKGYGYATVVEILSSALAGGAFLTALDGTAPDGKPAVLGFGHFFMAVDVAAFADPAAFRKTAGDILRQLRASRKAPGRGRIYTAGEKEYIAWMERRDTGLRLDSALQKELLQLKKEFGLTDYHFPFS